MSYEQQAPDPAPPGWYQDPQDPGGQRYWDGTTWGPQAYAAPARQNEGKGLLIAGIITGLLFPIVGLVIGIVLFVKGRASHGGAVLGACVVGVLIGVMLVTLGAASGP